MNKDKLIKILIPVVAVIVIIESVVLVSGLNKNEVSTQVEDKTPVVEQKEEGRSPVADYVFTTDTKEMKIGKSYKIILSLVGKEDFAVDAIETYVKFDPKMVSVSKLTAGTNLPEDKRVLKINDETGLISLTFLTSKESGYLVKADDNREVVSFVVTPKSEGTVVFDLVTKGGTEKLITVLPETGTSDELPFTYNKLEVNVTK